MSFSPTTGQVVLQEVFDEGSKPTDEEIHEYAAKIGIDVETESHLLYLAQDGLMQALPAGWKPCYDKDKREIYYFNFKTKKAQWEHPLDDIYRNLVKKARNEGTFSEQIDDDSRTSIKEDLKSFEEASVLLTTNEMYTKPKKLEPLSPLGKGILKKIPTALSPIKKSNSKELLKSNYVKSALQISEEKLMTKSDNGESQKQSVFNETEVRKRPNSSDIRNRRNIGPMEFMHLSKQEIIAPNTLEKLNFLAESKTSVDGQIIKIKGGECGIVTKDEGYGTEFSLSSLGEKDGGGKKELTLAGGGSVFLKSNKMKSSSSSDMVTSSFSREELSEALLSPDTRKFGNELESCPKSILREPTNLNLHEKPLVEREEYNLFKEELEDDKKSVRFNLEKELKVSFEVPSPLTKHHTELLSSSLCNASSKSEESLLKLNTNQGTKQIEVDFDDLEISLSDKRLEILKEENVPIDSIKTAEPKKFKPSQMLVREFREIFENKSKNNINLIENFKNDSTKNLVIDRIKSSQSGSNSSRSATSQSESVSNCSQEEKLSIKEKNTNSQIENSIGTTAKNSLNSIVKNHDYNSKVFDSAFDDLVDFAIKKKLDLEIISDRRGKIQYCDKDFLLEEILKGNGSNLSDESEDDKFAISQKKELEYLEKLESQISLEALKRKEMEKDVEKYEKMKEEKLKNLESEYQSWLENTKQTFEEKKKEESNNLKVKFQNWMKDREIEYEKEQREKFEKENEDKLKQLKAEFLKMEECEVEKMKSSMKDAQKNKLNELKRELETFQEKELNELKKSFENSMNEKKMELMKKHKEEISKIERNMEDLLSEQKSQKLKELELVRENEAVIEIMRLEMKESYQKQKNNLIKEHELLLENMKQEHSLTVEQLKIEFKNEEESLRKAHLNRLDEIKMRIEATEGKTLSENTETLRPENTEARVFEKVRCEKRLLEDKYKTLKEKYVRLKTDAKLTLENKKKKKESAAATASETEKSSSHKTNSKLEKGHFEDSNSQKKFEKEKKVKLKKQVNMEYLYNDISTEDEENLMSPKNLSLCQKSVEVTNLSKKHWKNDEKQLKSSSCEKLKDDSLGEEKKVEETQTKKKKQLFSRLKAASTSRINLSNKNRGKEALSPVENLRRQLKKLEELEDQFPVTTYTDTYMRYPFTDNAQFGSSEIEFFKHRIHLERESVRRAKDTLKSQRKNFESRQRELKERLIEGEPGSKSVIDQIYQEEKELTDMEVSVYRTRALLGEKIIRLRHLEQSLKRLSQPLKKDSITVKGKDFFGRLGVRNANKDDEKTLSDLSSYSGSSGFSSTDFNDSHNVVGGGIKKTDIEQTRQHIQNNIQEPSEIIQSLEILNSEIREIWEVLKKQRQSGHEPTTKLPPPPLLTSAPLQVVYGDLGWAGFTLPPPRAYRNTVITSKTNLNRPVAQQFKTQVTGAPNLSQVSTIVDSTLLDRTRSLRDWLKAARNATPSEAISSSQITL